jgi:hypothetical protein
VRVNRLLKIPLRVRATCVARFLVRLDQMALRGHIERIASGRGVRWRLASEA